MSCDASLQLRIAIGLRQKEPYCPERSNHYFKLNVQPAIQKRKLLTDISSTCFYKLDLKQLGEHLSQLTPYVFRILC